MAGLAADGYLMVGNATNGLESVADGLRVAARTGERFWEPELLRLRGELQIAQDAQSAIGDAEQAFRDAIERARSQGATLVALRSAVSLGRGLRTAGRSRDFGKLMVDMSHDIELGVGVSEAKILLSEFNATS